MTVEEYLGKNNFEFEERLFYNSRGTLPNGSWDNFLDKREGWFKLLKERKNGGNYGSGDTYWYIDDKSIYTYQELNDQSANITKVSDYKTVNDLIDIIDGGK